MTKFTTNGIAATNCMPLKIGEKTGKFIIAFHLPALELAGDVDGDGEVTVADALSVLRVAAKLALPTKNTGSAFDFDGDGEVTVADALSVLRIAAKLA